jgi:hypothetical protein
VDQSRIAHELVGANGAAGRQEPQNGDHSRGQPLEPRVNRNLRSIRLNRIFKQHVERDLVPKDVSCVRQLRASDVRQRLFIRCERPVGLERYLGGDNSWIRKAGLTRSR